MSLKSWGADPSSINRLFIGSLLTGLITVTVAFFVFEFLLQKMMAPYFFPYGGLALTPGTFRIRIGFRLIALFFVCNLIPFLSRTRDIIRRYRDAGARDILEAIIAELRTFRGTSRLEDDLTMVVIRISS